MKLKIALQTVSGKAYYLLVKELHRRKLPFLSLVPGKPAPSSIQVVITTKEERRMVDHPTVLVYNPEEDPSAVIDEAYRIIQNKESYAEVTVGIDPGKTFGVAVLADGKVLRKEQGLTMEMTVNTVLEELEKNPARTQKVKIGDGVPELASEITRRLHIALPKNVTIQIVSEAGTSVLRSKGRPRKISDADSAVEIAKKNGASHTRGKYS